MLKQTNAALGRRLDGFDTTAPGVASDVSHPVSARGLAKMLSERHQLSMRQAGGIQVPSRCIGRRTRQRSAVPKMCNRKAASLWMKKPDADSDQEEKCDVAMESHHVICGNTQHAMLDLQTNNSRKGGNSELRRKLQSTDSSDYEVESDMSDPENTSAVARGADAMVNMSISRPTEIIDTSKLAEEGKVETEYEEPPEEEMESQDHALVDEYEKTFAYARRLRALLNMEFQDADKGLIDTNFLLVKAHEHPTQRTIDRWRKVDMGISYNDQVKQQKLIEDSKVAAKKKSKKGKEIEPIYPETIKFTVRFRKDQSEKRWKDFMTFRQKAKKKLGNKASAVPKPSDKYLFAFLDVWSYGVVVFAKSSATVREIVDPVFIRLGLESRADFTFTIGCFNNDKRAGKAKIVGVPNLPEPVDMYQRATNLYKNNCTEIYVNDNRCEMFATFPDYYNKRMPDMPENDNQVAKKKKKAKDGDEAKNKSNTTAGDGNENVSRSTVDKAASQMAGASTQDSDRVCLSDEAAAFEQSSERLTTPHSEQEEQNRRLQAVTEAKENQ